MSERLPLNEAAAFAGFTNAETFRRYVNEGKLPIRKYQATRQSIPFYSKADIENYLESTATKKAS